MIHRHVLSLVLLLGVASAELVCHGGCGEYTCSSGVGYYCCGYCDCCMDVWSAWWFWLTLVFFISMFAICGGCFYRRRRYRYRYAIVGTAPPLTTATTTYNYGTTQSPYDSKPPPPPPYNPTT